MSRSDAWLVRRLTRNEAFWVLTDQAEGDECWMWRGTITAHGYGRLRKDGIYYPAHRISYEIHHGEIPDGFHVDHLCHNADPTCNADDHCLHRGCVNPSHLEAVPGRVNILRGKGAAANAARKTHCPVGHELAAIESARRARRRQAGRIGNARWRDAARSEGAGGLMGLKVCAEPGCPTLTHTTRCTEHTRARDKARGTRQERGYDARHDHLRAEYQRRMDAGEVFTCWRCGCEIDPRAWTLGHCDADRSVYHGPECPPCDYAVAGRVGCPHPSHA